jgi:predicted acetyltransferase
VDDIEIRPVAENERRAVMDTVGTALLEGPMSADALKRYDASWDGGDFLAAWERERCVGSVGAFRFDTTVPGGAQLSTSGVTGVGVLPTHTRRGLLTSLMTQLLTEARDSGTVLSSLRASEAPIYGRFGFGLAGDTATVAIDARRALPLQCDIPSGSMRILERHELLATVPPIYELARWRVGTISRPEWFWPLKLKEASKTADGPHVKGTFIAAHTTDVDDDGYVHYEVDWNEDFASNPTGKGRIIDLWGSSPQVELALWDYVLGIDIVIDWQAEPRPLDDPIRRVMYDIRAYETRQRLDEQWVRLLDVDAALVQRSYGRTNRSVTIEIDDPLFADNCGRWTLSTDGAERSDARADVQVDIATISAAYLGGVSFTEMAAAGALPDAPAQLLTDLNSLFAFGMAPFSGTMF